MCGFHELKQKFNHADMSETSHKEISAFIYLLYNTSFVNSGRFNIQMSILLDYIIIYKKYIKQRDCFEKHEPQS